MKMTHVIDATVVASVFFHEEHADRAQRLLASGADLFIPDLLYAEVGNVIWKRHERGELDATEASDMMQDLLQLPLLPCPCQALVPAALPLALSTHRTVYDCVYLALAIEKGSRVVTGDLRLFNALRSGLLGKYLLWIGDL